MGLKIYIYFGLWEIKYLIRASFKVHVTLDRQEQKLKISLITEFRENPFNTSGDVTTGVAQSV
jgi:hypothetical protein